MLEVQKQQKELLGKKLQRVQELALILKIHGGQTITREQVMQNENLQAKLEFRLNDLVMRSKIEEADIRIGIFEDMVKVLNNKT